MSDKTIRICDVCGGTGKLSVLSVKNTTGKTKPCPYCNGTGYYGRNNEYTRICKTT